MRPHPLTAALAVLLLYLTGGPLPAASGTSSAETASGPPPIALHGRLLEQGRPRPGTVWYWIGDQRGGAPGTPAAPAVGAIPVGADGGYEIRIARRLLPRRLVSRSGTVDLFLVAESGGRQLTYAATVDPARADVADFRFGFPASIRSSAGAGATAAQQVSRAVPAELSLTRLDPAGCAAANGRVHRLQEKFMRVDNWRGAPASVTQGRSSAHVLGVGVGASFSGSPVRWSASGTRTVAQSIEETQHGIVQKWAWNLVNYQDTHLTCSDGRGHTVRYTKRAPTGINTAFSRFTPAGSGPTYTAHCIRRSPSYEMTKNSARATTVAGGVDLGPISVSAQSGWNEGTRFHVRVLRRSWQCWSDPDGIAQSAVVQFRWKRYQSEPCDRHARGARCRPHVVLQ
jgi:hypothetical protein